MKYIALSLLALGLASCESLKVLDVSLKDGKVQLETFSIDLIEVTDE